MAGENDYSSTLGYIQDPKISEDIIVIDHNIAYSESASANYDVIVARGSLGGIYTYNSTKERTFPIQLEVVDYIGNASNIDRAKRLLRKWVQPQVNSEGYIAAPPQVLQFYYKGLTDEQSNNRSTVAGRAYETTSKIVNCILLDYNIVVDDTTGWNNVSNNDPTPKIMKVNLTLVDVEVKFRNRFG